MTKNRTLVEIKRDTLEEFSTAAWLASDNLFITPAEAMAAIEKYKLELDANRIARNIMYDDDFRQFV